MVPAELRQQKSLETLPANFNDWDSKSLPSTLPEDFEEFDASDASTRSAAASVWHAPLNTPESSATQPLNREAYVAPISDQEPLEDQPASIRNRRKVIMWVGSALLVALMATGGATLAYRKHNSIRPAFTAHPADAQRTTQNLSSTPKPDAGAPLQQAVAQPGAPLMITSNSMTQGGVATPVHVDSAAMTEQLNAPARIQKGSPHTHDDAAPQEFTADDMRVLTPGANGAAPNFSRKSPQVKQEPVITGPVRISSSEALAMVLQRHSPVYPQIALALRITGVVSLRVRVSTNGSVVSADPISGPKMLYAAATDSIRSWRFRPLLISQRPVEFITDINVNFQFNN
jgi:TonB family protein